MSEKWWNDTPNWSVGCSGKDCSAFLRCWAARMAWRHAKNPKAPERYHAPGLLNSDRHWTGKVVFDRQAMIDAFDSMKPGKIHACGFMTDLFDDNASLESLRFLAVEIGQRRDIGTVVFTTKQPENLLKWQQTFFPNGLPPNVMSLLSICTQEEADRKIHVFLQVKGRIGLHCEPMLEALNLSMYIEEMEYREIEWLACGPENGHHKRPFNIEWARDLRRQCRAAGVRFFFKPGLLDGEANEGISQ